MGSGLISHFCSPQPDNSLRRKVRGPGLVDRRNVSVVDAAHSCSSSVPTRGEMARLCRPRATVCKFPGHRNMACSDSSDRYGIRTRGRPVTSQRATPSPPRHTFFLSLGIIKVTRKKRDYYKKSPQTVGRGSAHPPSPDTMTNTALEATAMSSAKNRLSNSEPREPDTTIQISHWCTGSMILIWFQ